MTITARFPIQFRGQARPEAMVLGPLARFTVLTSRMIRLEWSPAGRFEDRPSQAFWYREQPVPPHQVRRSGDRMELETEHLLLVYRASEIGFGEDALAITLKESGRTWRCGDQDPDNLGGTARTLDRIDGARPLEPGLFSRSGWAVVDDSDRLVFDERGWLCSRDASPGTLDLVFFGYGQDYARGLQDFFRVAGRVPLLPRWALGNWWSRYWAYSSDELLALMKEFKRHQVPLSVCIVDMDWHLTRTGNQCSGWTGYTWNRDLFPDPPAFIRALHDLGLKTALNLHPAEGVHPHEAQYRAMAERLGIDPESSAPIPFDIADPAFTRAYLELLHHPHEAQGIDFWWVDWQQGSLAGLPGLDPLWWLNHLHFHDLARHGDRRPFVFSRWGGLGNHRYPIGFSGDTVVSWDSLAFQPYFTATAANVGYGWWSHDIGGHMGGIEDRELYARWVQFGVLSPILRLHCTKNPYHERRPWGYDAETLRVTREAMQLRHALIPYLYTLSWRYRQEGQAPVRPLYHDYPADQQAYHCPDQYCFGAELLAAPFTRPADPETRLSRQVLWLPPGLWFDFFSGQARAGDGWKAIYGRLDEIPLLARAGAIVPLAPRSGWGGVENPPALELHLFPGADNRFDLYEDDGLASCSLIPFSQRWEPGQLSLEIGPARGDTAHLPRQRDHTLIFKAIAHSPALQVTRNGEALSLRVDYDPQRAVLRLEGISLSSADTLRVVLTAREGSLLAQDDPRPAALRKLLRTCRLDSWVKQAIDRRLGELLDRGPAGLADYELALSEPVARALVEILTGSGYHVAHHPADGSQRVLFWNNNGSEAIQYRFLGFSPEGRVVRRQGPLPRFALFRPEGQRLHLLSDGEGPPELFQAAHWRLGVSLLGRDWQPLGESQGAAWSWQILHEH